MTPPVPGPRAGLNAAVAAEIRAEMARQRLSAADLAESSEVPYGTLRRYLSAERHIDVAVLAQVAQALGLSAAGVVAIAQQRVDFSFPGDDVALDRETALEAETRRVAETAARRTAEGVVRSHPESEDVGSAGDG